MMIAKAKTPGKFRRILYALLLLPLPLVFSAGATNAAEDNPEQEDQAVQEQESTDNSVLDVPGGESHAQREAGTDLLLLASQEPEVFVGMNLEFTDGKPVGRIMDVKRRLENLKLYLIVDAEPYFNDAVVYAVAVEDVKKVTADSVQIELQPGMHLRGLQYYAGDYTAAGDNFPEAGLEKIADQHEQEVE